MEFVFHRQRRERHAERACYFDEHASNAARRRRLMNTLALEHPSGSVLVAYGLGQVDEIELADIDRHLAECDLCRKVVEGVPPDSFLTLLLATDTEPDSPKNGVPHPAADSRQ